MQCLVAPLDDFPPTVILAYGVQATPGKQISVMGQA